MKRMFIFPLLITLVLGGCIPSNQLEKMGILYAAGIDRTHNGEVELSAVIQQFEAQSANNTKMVTGKADTLRGTLQNANLETNFHLGSGKVQIVLFGMDTAKQDLGAYIDTLRRDPVVPNTLYLAVSETTARKILQTSYSAITVSAGRYLHDVIDRNSNDDVFPKVPLYNYFVKLSDIGQDPMLPMFHLYEGIPKMDYIALFQKGKYVGKLSMGEKYLLNMLESKVKGEFFDVSVPTKALKQVTRSPLNSDDKNKNVRINFEIAEGKGRIRVVDMDKLDFHAKIKMEVHLIETSRQLDFNNPQTASLLKKKVEKEVEKKYDKLLHHLQSVNSDVIGFGNIYRANLKGHQLTEKEWRDKFPKVNVKFDADVKIVGHGEMS